MLYTDIKAIRRTMSEVDPYMPEVTERNIYTKAKVTAELKALLVGRTEQQIMDMILAGGQEITRARQLMGLSKLDAVSSYISEQATDHPVVVGFWHTSVGTKLEDLLEPRFRVGYIDGSTSAAKRERVKQAFIAGDLDVLIGQIAAMGIAMDGLQFAGDHVVFAELDWSAAKHEQFYKRLARKGQVKHVQVDYCTSLETVDTALEKIRFRKAQGASEILDKEK
jgi:SNF2 family DNA or RNA helicase